MKRICWLVGLMIMLSGCDKNDPLDHAVAFREVLLGAEGCSFQADITADYGDTLHQFGMKCSADSVGNLKFEITQPESIAGIRGEISNEGGKITFDDKFVYFPLMTDDLLTPASAPWIFLKTLRGGYIRSVGWEEPFLRMTVDDSYADDALMLDIWMEEDRLVRADILHDGKRILSLNVRSFSYL